MTFRREDLFLNEELKKKDFWALDDVHFSNPFTPLFASYMVPAVSEGTKKAFEYIKAPMKQFLVKLDNGYFYQAVLPVENFEARLEEHKKTIGPLFSKQAEIFESYVKEFFEPLYNKLDGYKTKKFTRNEAIQAVGELFEDYQRAWELHFRVVISRGSLGLAFEAVYGEVTGSPNTTEAYELLVGAMNKTLDADRKYWSLANEAKANKELLAIFKEQNVNKIVERLKTTEIGEKFLRKLQAVLEEYGYRTVTTHEFAEETWIENPVYALGLVKNYVEKDYDFDAEYEKAIKLRERKLQDVLQRIPEGEGKEQFKALHQFTINAWGLDEDHNVVIDQMLPAKSRFFLLNIGDLLVKDGVIAKNEDIFFLYLDELKELLIKPKTAYNLVEERRVLLAAQKQLKPDVYFGEPPKEVDLVVERIFGLKPPKISEQGHRFEGYAGSKGSYTGTVHVIRGQEEFHTFKKGEILVCKLTIPTWTVLFGLAGAIVTDTGGILSHTATVAREYGVPAVVGAKVATSLLKDGDVITVDGTKGVVIIESSC